MRHLITTLAAGALLTAGSASAEEVDTWKRMTLERADAPEAGSQSGRLPTAFAVTAGVDSSEAAISATQSWEDPGDKLGTHNLSLRLAATFNKDEGAASFLSGGQPVSGTSFELTYSHDSLPGSFQPPTLGVPVFRAAYNACRVKEGAKIPLPATLTGKDLETAVAEKEKQVDKTCGPSLDGPNPETPRPTFNVLRTYLSEDEQRAYLDEPFLSAPLIRWGLSGKVGYDEFAYRDVATFSKTSTERVSFSASVFTGAFRYFGKNGVYVGGGAEYGEGYDEASARTLCQAPPATGPQECFTGAFAKPDRKKTADLFSVVRWQPTPTAETKGRPGFKGLEAKAAYDFEHDVASLGASLYLFSDGDNKPRGGLRFLWQSDDNDPATDDDNFNVGIFVGVPFSAF